VKRIGIYGGSFNPPGIHHRLIAENLLCLGCVDQLMVIPCGQRKDKLFVDGIDRGNMIRLAFANLAGCVVNTFNLDLGVFTSNFKYEAMFGCLGEIWHIVGSDQVINAQNGMSTINTRWENGDWVLKNLRFIVIERPGYKIVEADLPTNRLVLQLLIEGSSTQIRQDISADKNTEFLSEEVSAYIADKKLYKVVP